MGSFDEPVHTCLRLLVLVSLVLPGLNEVAGLKGLVRRVVAVRFAKAVVFVEQGYRDGSRAPE